MIFLGYDENTKGFRCFNQDSRKIVVSRDVVFGSDSSRDSTKMSDNKNDEPELEVCLSDCRKEIQTEVFTDNQAEENNGDHDLQIEDVNRTDGRVSPEISCDQRDPCVGNDNQDTDTGGVQHLNAPTTQEVKPRRSSRSTKMMPPFKYIQSRLYKVTPPLTIKEPRNIDEVLKSVFKKEWIDAMQEEMNSLKANQTWELVNKPPDKNIVGSRWVYKSKRSRDGNINCFKARLVAQGFSQRFGQDYDEVFAPVLRQTTFRMLLSVAAMRNYVVHHFDVKTAFLNGKLDDVIYMRQPPGFEEEGQEEKVCLLKKSLYGLKQAAKVWNDLLKKCLFEQNFQQSENDPCLFFKKTSTGKSVYVLVYVDDLLVISDEVSEIKNVEVMLKKTVDVKDLGKVFCYLGINVEQDENGNFLINQQNYIKEVLLEFGLQNAGVSNVPISNGYGKSDAKSSTLTSNKEYQRLLGSLLYIAINSRPDISASICILAQKASKPNSEDWVELKRVLKYLKGTSGYKLALSKCLNNSQQLLVGFSDANWGENRIDRKSNSGFLIKMFGGIVSWCCRKQNCVALSSSEAEYIALSETSKEIIWMRRVLEELGYKFNQATTIYEDNQSCIVMSSENRSNNRTKHIDIRYHHVRDSVTKKIIECEYLCTEKMLADIMTKPLSGVRFKTLRDQLGFMNDSIEEEY
jgi:hypothetical protein